MQGRRCACRGADLDGGLSPEDEGSLDAMSDWPEEKKKKKRKIKEYRRVCGSSSPTLCSVLPVNVGANRARNLSSGDESRLPKEASCPARVSQV